jgi:hypothetical protein
MGARSFQALKRFPRVPWKPTLPATATATEPDARAWPSAIETIWASCGAWMTWMAGRSTSASNRAWVADVVQLKMNRTPAARSCSTTSSPPVPSTVASGAKSAV